MLNNLGPWLIALAGVIASLGTWYAAKRENNRKDKLDPVSVVSQAIQTTSDGLTGVITSLQTEVSRLHAQLAIINQELINTRNQLIEVQADLLVTRTENKRLQAQVASLRADLRTFGET